MGGAFQCWILGTLQDPLPGRRLPQRCGAEPEAVAARLCQLVPSTLGAHVARARQARAHGGGQWARRGAGPAQPLLHPGPPGVAAAPCAKQELLLQGRQRMMKPGRNLSWQPVGCWREPPGACTPPAPPPLPSHGNSTAGAGRVPVGAAASSGGLAPAWLPVAALASLTCPESCMSTPQQAPGQPEDLARGWAETRQTRFVPGRWCLGSHAGRGGGGAGAVARDFQCTRPCSVPRAGGSVDMQDGAVRAMVPG